MNQNNTVTALNGGTECSFSGLAMLSPSRIDSVTLPYSRSNMALPEVSRVMFSASKIGTPLETSVPRVRVVRAIMFFSTSCPNTGTLSVNKSQPTRP